MSKKLLKEGTVRKFMKLANLSSFSNNFVNEKYDMDEELEEGDMAYKRDDLDEGGMGMAYKRDDLHEEEDALEDPESGDEDDEPMGDNEELFKRVVKAIADELDVEVDLEDATGGGDDMDMDLGDEDDEPMDDEPMDDEPMDDEDDEPMGDEEALEEEALNEAILNLLNRSNIQVVDDSVMTEALVKRVAARVARRLLKESL